MPFEVIRNDIAKVTADAIVDTANPKPRIGAGADHAIHLGAGPELLEARKAIGDIQPGHVAVTPAFGLKAKYIIHAVGPAWKGGNENEETLLRQTYDNALKAAVDHQCKSVAFPLMSTGTYGFPKEKGMPIAVSAFTDFLMSHNIRIILVVFDRVVFELSGQLLDDVHGYVDDNYVDAMHAEEYDIHQCVTDYEKLKERLSDQRRSEIKSIIGIEETATPRCRTSTQLSEIVEQTDVSFHGKLFQLIDERGFKEPTVYKAADISRQQFSQIRSNPNYHPTRNAAIRFALALKLDYEATQEFLSSAGYTLTQSNPADIIVKCCIDRGEFDTVKINSELYERNLPLLSNARE